MHYETCSCANGFLSTRIMCSCPYQDARFNITEDEDYLTQFQLAIDIA